MSAPSNSLPSHETLDHRLEAQRLVVFQIQAIIRNAAAALTDAHHAIDGNVSDEDAVTAQYALEGAVTLLDGLASGLDPITLLKAEQDTDAVRS